MYIPRITRQRKKWIRSAASISNQSTLSSLNKLSGYSVPPHLLSRDIQAIMHRKNIVTSDRSSNHAKATAAGTRIFVCAVKLKATVCGKVAVMEIRLHPSRFRPPELPLGL